MDKFISINSSGPRLGFINFMRDMYFWFLDILYEYIVIHGHLTEEDLENLPRAGVNPIRANLDMLFGIKSLLYGNYVSQDAVNISVFAVRGYIESWARSSFSVFCDQDGDYIQIGKILDAYKDAAREVGDPYCLDLYKWANSLSLINDWANFYVHWKEKVIFWAPYFIEIYLTRFHGELRIAIAQATGTQWVTPPLTSEGSNIFNKVNEILFTNSEAIADS